MEQSKEFLIKLDKTEYKTPDISKKGSFVAANNIYTSIMEGNTSAIQTAEMFKFVEETYKQLKELSDDSGKNSFTELVREEISSNSDDGKSMTTKFGNKFELMEASTKYDFSACGDPIWNDLSEHLEYVKMALKERETFLKSLKSPIILEIVNPRTGEVFPDTNIYPPIKSSTSTFKQTMING